MIIESYLRLIKEAVDMSHISNEDFRDIFIQTFRAWLREKAPDAEKTYALTYLLKKFGKKFVLEMNLIDRDDDYEDITDFDDLDYRNRTLIDFGRRLVEKEVVKPPKYEEYEKSFMENYGKHFNSIMSYLKLPDYAKLVFEEPQPYVLRGKILVDFPKMIKSDERLKTLYSYEREITEYLKNWFGIQVGDRKYGELNFVMKDIDYNGFEEWLKTEWKTLRKEIKAREGDIFYKFTLEPIQGRLQIRPGFKGGKTSNRYKVERTILEFLKSKGYTNVEVDS